MKGGKELSKCNSLSLDLLLAKIEISGVNSCTYFNVLLTRLLRVYTIISLKEALYGNRGVLPNNVKLHDPKNQASISINYSTLFLDKDS